MSSTPLQPARNWFATSSPSLPWWGALVAALALTAFVHWVAGVVVLLAFLTQRLAPLDLFVSFLVVVVAASFMDYTQGRLTAQLSLLSLLLVFMLYCYIVAKGRNVLTLRWSVLTLPLLLYLGLTIFNFGRGVMVGNSLRYAGLELLAVLGLASSLLLAATNVRREQLKFAVGLLIVLSLVHLAWGVSVYQDVGVRTGILSFTPVPGVAAMVVFNLGLRARTGLVRAAMMLLIAPLLVHQFISFTRGYWLATAAGCLFSLILYVGRGEGARSRWLRVAGYMGVSLVAALVGAILAGAVLGYSDLGGQALDRFTSSFGTEIEYETGSNFVRLSEYLTTVGHIADSPWVGHGLGFAFVKMEPFSKEVFEQWFVHQNYLLVWLKQGLLGLVLFVWLLVSGVRLGLRGRAIPDPVPASWCVGTAAASLYVLVYAMVHFPLGEVNTVFVLALMWGVSMSILRGNRSIVRWGTRHASATPDAEGSARSS